MTDQPITAHDSQVASTSLGAVKSPRFRYWHSSGVPRSRLMKGAWFLLVGNFE